MKIYKGYYEFKYDGFVSMKKTPLFVSEELCLRFMEKKGVNIGNVSFNSNTPPHIETIEVQESLPEKILSDIEIEKIFEEIHSRYL